MKKIGSFLIALMLPAIMLVGCSSKGEEVNNVATNKFVEIPEKPEKLPTATIKIKGYGEMVAELYPQKAPNTVNNFIELANKKFYDGLTVHRIVKDFVIQGGDPVGNGSGGPGYDIVGEFKANGFDANDIVHEKGVLSMARGGQPDTAGSQFFIVTKKADHLNEKYAGFGKVVEGLDVLDKLNNIEVSGEGPIEKVEIEAITINSNGYEAKEAVKIK